MLGISTIIFIVFPFLSLPLIILGLLNAKKRVGLYCFFIAFILGIIAYYYVPNQAEDLFYHLHTIDYIQNALDKNMIIHFDLTEPLTLLIKYFIALTNNKNLLQFFVGLLSYFLIFYMTSIFVAERKVATKLLIYLFVFSTFNFLTVISNLFCNLALLVFCLGIFREYFMKKKDYINYIIYFASVLIHNSLIFPLIILMIYKMSKKKNVKSMFIKLTIFIFGIPLIIEVLSHLNFIPFVSVICDFYNSYFINNSDFSEMHTSSTIVLYLLKMLPFFMTYLILKNKKCNDECDNLVFFYFYSIMILIFSTTFAIRFIPIVVILGTPTIGKIFSQLKYKNTSLLLTFIIIACSILFFRYQFIKTDISKIKIDSDILIKNVITVFLTN